MVLHLAEAAPSVRVAVYDLLGREVSVVLAGALASGVHRAEVPVVALSAGVYVVWASVNTGGGAVVRTARLTVAR